MSVETLLDQISKNRTKKFVKELSLENKRRLLQYLDKNEHIPENIAQLDSRLIELLQDRGLLRSCRGGPGAKDIEDHRTNNSLTRIDSNSVHRAPKRDREELSECAQSDDVYKHSRGEEEEWSVEPTEDVETKQLCKSQKVGDLIDIAEELLENIKRNRESEMTSEMFDEIRKNIASIADKVGRM